MPRDNKSDREVHREGKKPWECGVKDILTMMLMKGYCSGTGIWIEWEENDWEGKKMPRGWRVEEGRPRQKEDIVKRMLGKEIRCPESRGKRR